MLSIKRKRLYVQTWRFLLLVVQWLLRQGTMYNSGCSDCRNKRRYVWRQPPCHVWAIYSVSTHGLLLYWMLVKQILQSYRLHKFTVLFVLKWQRKTPPLLYDTAHLKFIFSNEVYKNMSCRDLLVCFRIIIFDKYGFNYKWYTRRTKAEKRTCNAKPTMSVKQVMCDKFFTT